MTNNYSFLWRALAAAVLLFGPLGMTAAIVRGRVVDSANGQPMVGATVRVLPSGPVRVTDAEGAFTFEHLEARPYELETTYISYQRLLTMVDAAHTDTVVVMRLTLQPTDVGTATVSATVRRNTEQSMVTLQRNSLVVQSGISAQQISRSQDKDASEVVRRVPGISIIDDKFVMVRGLSQRYNNVWLNGSAVPSSEPDTRAFSFDLIPSSQLDNVQIVKSPAPQYPADFSGGFILINTKDVPAKNSASVALGGAVNDRTHWQEALLPHGSRTDFLGFDNGRRNIKGGMNAPMLTLPGSSNISLIGNGLDNNWRPDRLKPAADVSLAADVSRRLTLGSEGGVMGIMGALNYSNTYKTYSPMENSFFGAYDVTHDRSNYLRRSIDHQYNHNVRLGALLGLTFAPARGTGRYEWKNIFNQLGTNRYTRRSGFNAQSNKEESAEYYYSSRTTYSTQLTGKYVWEEDRLDWNAGYAYANRHLPDRRRYRLDNALDASRLGLPTGNDVSREFTHLNEHIASVGANYRHTFDATHLSPELLAGFYGEYRTRSYRTRSFIYGWNPSSNTLPEDFAYIDLPTELMRPENYGSTGFYLKDDTKMTDDYDGRQYIGAGYAAVRLPLGAWSVLAGVRYEYFRMRLIRNTRDDVRSPMNRDYDGSDFFPSVNITYKLRRDQQLRLAYGRTINRPEFREVSPSVFYDFDLASNVQGNVDLTVCHVDNLDLRYEWYPASGDQISLAAFFKNFDAPIEWTYTVAGGTDLVYSYQNARRAYSYGLELDVRKSLDFIGLRGFTLVFNGALIKSRVLFAPGLARQDDRPMQGQSPYLVNAGLFYSRSGWDVGALYNRIGKRLIGVGRNLGSTADQTVKVPDSYEMPRNSLDLSAAKQLGHWQLKLGIKDVLAERVRFKQFGKANMPDGTHKKTEETTRSFRPGRTVSLNVSYRF